MTAEEVLAALKAPLSRANYPIPGWVARAATIVYPRKKHRPAGYYATTQVRFYTEVTVRIPRIKTARRTGQKYSGLQRRRLDLVALIQANKFKYTPIVAGIEVKVSEHDLTSDRKMADYLPYCNLFYLACPAELEPAARIKQKELGTDRVGLLLVFPDRVEHTHPNVNLPGNRHLQEIYAELLIRRFTEAEFNQAKESGWARLPNEASSQN